MWETPQKYGRWYSGQIGKIELFGHQGKCYVWRKPTTSHHSEKTITQGSMVLAASCCGDVFPSAGTGKLVRIEGMDGAK